MSTNSDDHTIVKHNDYQEVEVDYALALSHPLRGIHSRRSNPRSWT